MPQNTEFIETTFVNGGEIYKLMSGGSFPSAEANGVKSTYRPTEHGECDIGELCRFVSEKTMPDGSKRTKRYRSTSQIRSALNLNGGASLSGPPVCPAVNTWLAVATHDEDPEFLEWYFSAESERMIRDVAEFYGLPAPVAAEQAADMESDPWSWGVRVLGIDGVKTPIVAASIAFRSGTPYLFKLYKSNVADLYRQRNA